MELFFKNILKNVDSLRYNVRMYLRFLAEVEDTVNEFA